MKTDYVITLHYEGEEQCATYGLQMMVEPYLTAKIICIETTDTERIEGMNKRIEGGAPIVQVEDHTIWVAADGCLAGRGIDKSDAMMHLDEMAMLFRQMIILKPMSWRNYCLDRAKCKAEKEGIKDIRRDAERVRRFAALDKKLLGSDK